jgi:hypothetical protein
MGMYDVPLESIIIALSIVLVYVSYYFSKRLGTKFKQASNLFFMSFIFLFISSILDLLDEFYSAFLIDIGGEIVLIITFSLFILALTKFNAIGGKK